MVISPKSKDKPVKKTALHREHEQDSYHINQPDVKHGINETD